MSNRKSVFPIDFNQHFLIGAEGNYTEPVIDGCGDWETFPGMEDFSLIAGGSVKTNLLSQTIKTDVIIMVILTKIIP